MDWVALLVLLGIIFTAMAATAGGILLILWWIGRNRQAPPE
jgi:hypothetical protein